jgi:hypothetical protein
LVAPPQGELNDGLSLEIVARRSLQTVLNLSGLKNTPMMSSFGLKLIGWAIE